ncbi:hypothetical protein GWK47_050611 [Chionoecetes opilio]|uniref:Uncharacterized protein n=1 Tax=Chionoecetes opilio TaxID=41210 RepID=A0A8J5CR39_CHIOP|nr:hypothetical protein GWK47_050611 [Chionoecetes opilio]
MRERRGSQADTRPSTTKATDIGMICCTLSDVEWIGTGSTTTAGAEHRAWKLAPHTATFPTSTCPLRCAATSDQLENVLRGIGNNVLHKSRDETLVSVISFPPVFHCSESWWIPTQGTVPVSDFVVCSTNVLFKHFCSWGQTTQLRCCCRFASLLCP